MLHCGFGAGLAGRGDHHPSGRRQQQRYRTNTGERLHMLFACFKLFCVPVA